MKSSLSQKVITGFSMALMLLVIIGVMSYRSAIRSQEDAAAVTHTHEVLQALESILSLTEGVETGARGFVITGDEHFLEPVADADKIPPEFEVLKLLLVGNPGQQMRLDKLQVLVQQRITISRELIDLRKAQGFEPAQTQVKSNRGKNVMDSIRALIGEMKDVEQGRLDERERASQASASQARYVILIGSLLAVLLTLAAIYIIQRDIARRTAIEQERERLIADLKAALAQVKSLSGLLPMCANCKKIQDDKGNWHILEQYIESHSEAGFSHGLCPDCAKKFFPEQFTGKPLP